MLTLFGLPVGEDMDGRVMVDACEEAPSIQRVPTWEDGTRPGSEDSARDAAADRVVVEQLVALGYLDALSPDAERNAARAEADARLAPATVSLSTRRPSQALPLLEALHADDPADDRTALLLA